MIFTESFFKLLYLFVRQCQSVKFCLEQFWIIFPKLLDEQNQIIQSVKIYLKKQF